MPLELYSLEAILGHDTKKKEEEAVKDWLIPSLLVEDDPSISVLCKDNHYKGFSHNKLQPFTSKVKTIKPDLGFSFKENQVLFFMIEVHSQNYCDTVAKTVANTIDQLRLFRLYSTDVDTVSSFVFPRFAKMDRNGRVMSRNEYCVTQVNVKWKQMLFTVDFTYIDDPKEVEKKVKTVFQKQKMLFDGRYQSDRKDYFIRLSKDDLDYVQQCIDSRHSLRQIQSTFSIVLEETSTNGSGDDLKIFKIIPDIISDSKVGRMEKQKHKKEITNLSLPIDTLLICDLAVHVFQKHVKHMNGQEAKKCLIDFVPHVRESLIQLHNLGYAHLDVRLPNICFTPNGDVRLIDFDRIQRVFAPPPFKYSGSFMYTGSPGTTVEQLDWKQFGIMIYCILQLYVISEADVKENDVSHLPEDSFLYRLIYKYTYDVDSFQVWKEEIKEECSDTLQQVITSRAAQ